MTKTRARELLAMLLILAALLSLGAAFMTDASAEGEGTRATGYCSVCGETCSYTVGYEQWTDSIHAIRRWCSNCGYDQTGGAMSEPHSYNAHGTCTKCGYYNSAYDQYLCDHGSTYTRWNAAIQSWWTSGALTIIHTSHVCSAL